MLQVKLVDIYGTKYFYATMVKDLNYLFGSVSRIQKGDDYTPNNGSDELARIYESARNGEEIVFDLANARLTNDACKAILAAQHNGIKFCDSFSGDRDRLVKINSDRLLADKSGWVPLPAFDYKQDILEYVKSLEAGVFYTPTGMSERIEVALACIITMVRPDVTLCIDNIITTMFKFIATKVPNSALLKDTEFYFFTEYGVEEITDVNHVYVQEIAESVNIKEAIQYGIVVPKKFGKEVLIRDEEWTSLFKSCLTIIEEFQESCPKKLSEIYGG